jgi:hypothetical protein
VRPDAVVLTAARASRRAQSVGYRGLVRPLGIRKLRSRMTLAARAERQARLMG